MKKREKRFNLSKETIGNLITPAENLADVLGGSCNSSASTVGGSQRICCGDNTY
ncbi:MAG TPA: hypothetical protein VN783_13520 [Thermoanaerobaculia bacterium]|nr:hypothetical protein [Thermoanaerobaculia bacterium]